MKKKTSSIEKKQEEAGEDRLSCALYYIAARLGADSPDEAERWIEAWARAEDAGEIPVKDKQSPVSPTPPLLEPLTNYDLAPEARIVLAVLRLTNTFSVTAAQAAALCNLSNAETDWALMVLHAKRVGRYDKGIFTRP